jgi:hypothetical protein
LLFHPPRLALELGAAAEQVTVTAEVSLLEESTATRGQVITSDHISMLPLDGNNPLTLMNLGVDVSIGPRRWVLKPGWVISSP